MELTQELVKKKIELLEQQKAKSTKLNELLDAPGGFNEVSRKTCKNLEAAITASKRPGYFAYYEQPEHVKNVLRSGEVQRLQEQILHLQKQIEQLTEKIEKSAEGQDVGHTETTITSLKHWLAPTACRSSIQPPTCTPSSRQTGRSTGARRTTLPSAASLAL
ncbi:hypothetical protein GQ600_16635 [Phytophthora cactorum]|nr:hypothetical protein GQ600_16635 [Phytophthora cactorum]